MPKFKPGDRVEAYFQGKVYWGVGEVYRVYGGMGVEGRTVNLYELKWVTPIQKKPHYIGGLSSNWEDFELAPGATQCLL